MKATLLKLFVCMLVPLALIPLASASAQTAASPAEARAIASSQAKAFWQPQGPTFRGAKIWRVPEPFTGPASTVEHWIEAQTGMSLDERGVMTWLDGYTWRLRMQEFAKSGRINAP